MSCMRAANATSIRSLHPCSNWEQADCGAGPAAGGLRIPASCHERRPDLLWPRQSRPVPPRCRLRRSHSQGREAGRPSGAGAEQVRTSDQPQDREGAPPRHSHLSSRPRRRGDRMKRRAFITLLGSAAAAWPLAARAQQPAMPVIGFFGSETLTDMPQDRVTAFRQGLKEAGFVEDQNVAIEYRWDEGQTDRLPLLVQDLLRRQVALIVSFSTPAALAAKAATTTVPVVFVSGGDPVQLGLVASLNRPGGNITGFSFITGELGAKRLGLLRELRPGATRIAVLVDPKWPPAER